MMRKFYIVIGVLLCLLPLVYAYSGSGTNTNITKGSLGVVAGTDGVQSVGAYELPVDYELGAHRLGFYPIVENVTIVSVVQGAFGRILCRQGSVPYVINGRRVCLTETQVVLFVGRRRAESAIFCALLIALLVLIFKRKKKQR